MQDEDENMTNDFVTILKFHFKIIARQTTFEVKYMHHLNYMRLLESGCSDAL